MAEIETAAQAITEKTSPDCNIIFGANIDHNIKGTIKISVIATGFDPNHSRIFSSTVKPIYFNTPKPSLIKINDDEDENDFKKDPPKDNNLDIDQYLDENELPAGVDIVDEFDIPAFMRKNKK